MDVHRKIKDRSERYKKPTERKLSPFDARKRLTRKNELVGIIQRYLKNAYF